MKNTFSYDPTSESQLNARRYSMVVAELVAVEGQVDPLDGNYGHRIKVAGATEADCYASGACPSEAAQMWSTILDFRARNLDAERAERDACLASEAVSLAAAPPRAPDVSENPHFMRWRPHPTIPNEPSPEWTTSREASAAWMRERERVAAVRAEWWEKHTAIMQANDSRP